MVAGGNNMPERKWERKRKERKTKQKVVLLCLKKIWGNLLLLPIHNWISTSSILLLSLFRRDQIRGSRVTGMLASSPRTFAYVSHALFGKARGGEGEAYCLLLCQFFGNATVKWPLLCWERERWQQLAGEIRPIRVKALRSTTKWIKKCMPLPPPPSKKKQMQVSHIKNVLLPSTFPFSPSFSGPLHLISQWKIKAPLPPPPLVCTALRHPCFFSPPPPPPPPPLFIFAAGTGRLWRGMLCCATHKHRGLTAALVLAVTYSLSGST